MSKTCLWCKRPLTKHNKTKDHILPRSRGGRKTAPCCLACNQMKGDMTPEQWNAVRTVHPLVHQWWPTTNFRGQRLFAHLMLNDPNLEKEFKKCQGM